MASIGQIRGALLEEVVLRLLARTGYNIIKTCVPGTQMGPAGLEVRGRGCWHQIDAFAEPKYSPPFMYPVRLLLEAKCYENRPIDIRIVRAALGTVTDINQCYGTRTVDGREINVEQFNYRSAIFSTSRYTDDAQQFAIAHQVFLIDYENVPLLENIITALLSLRVDDFPAHRRNDVQLKLGSLRTAFASFLEGSRHQLEGHMLPSGIEKMAQVIEGLSAIQGSYFGMIEGKYATHLLARQRITEAVFELRQQVRCKIRVDGNVWAFEPSQVPENDPRYFRLEFQLPTVIAQAANEQRENWEGLAALKRDFVSFVDAAGEIDGRFTTFRLVLDEDWLNDYVQRRRVRIGPREMNA